MSKERYFLLIALIFVVDLLVAGALMIRPSLQGTLVPILFIAELWFVSVAGRTMLDYKRSGTPIPISFRLKLAPFALGFVLLAGVGLATTPSHLAIWLIVPAALLSLASKLLCTSGVVRAQ